jgi:hypothetical protein
MLHHLRDAVVGGSRPRRNVTDQADGPRTGASKLLRSTGSTGVTQCRPTNTSARPATSAWKPSKSSPTRPSPPVPNAAGTYERSSPRWASSLRVQASIRTTVGAPRSRPRRRPARRRPHLRRQPTPVQPRQPRLRRRRLQRPPRRRRPTRSLRPRCSQSRWSDRPHSRATTRGRSRRTRCRATCAAALTPR